MKKVGGLGDLTNLLYLLQITVEYSHCKDRSWSFRATWRMVEGNKYCLEDEGHDERSIMTMEDAGGRLLVSRGLIHDSSHANEK